MTDREVRLVYFSWVRERIGVPEERLVLPSDIITAGDLVRWLATRDDAHAFALQSPSTIRVAVDQMHVSHDEAITEAREIALFPPMTGG
ncbi:molybdopterin converting factor subunit 1 [Oryzibacter oryziterrae]|uniref:molybdopterin converting factor subunit 1 n=1 Tax=Oryzibacter oryziterrae TaxID=2766474 RepID=UPI001F005799|nr:molybdopterin converting factor subunit 1 [Oryzibacter oryziterrae]